MMVKVKCRAKAEIQAKYLNTRYKMLVSQGLCSAPWSLLGVYDICLGKQREYICGFTFQCSVPSSHTLTICVHSKVLCGLGFICPKIACLKKP